MKYWVYINNKVTGPFSEDKLVTLDGFTPDTLLCTDEAANSGKQEWVKASSIFEFEEPAPEPAPTAAAAPAQTAAPTPAVSGADASLTAALLAKLDAVTSQLSGMQNKLDGMQNKIDQSIASQEKAAADAAKRAEELAEQVTHISSNKTPAQPIKPTPESVDPSAIIAPAVDDETRTLELTLPGELANVDATEQPLDSDVLNSALDSLHSPKEQTQEEKESTFQDLLTPQQAKVLEAQAQANQAAQENEQAKKDVLSEFTTEKAQEDIVDQVIKEKEEDEEKKSKTLRWISAGAAALAGAVGLKKKMDNDEAKTQETSAEEKPAEEAAQPASDLETLPKEEATEVPAEETTQLEEKPEQAPTEEPQPLAEEKPAELQEGAQPTEQAADLPSLDAALPVAPEPTAEGQEVNPFPQALEEKTENTETMQELVPNAQTDKKENTSEDLITEADLQEAFTERKKNDVPVEQLFGLAGAGAAVAAAAAGGEDKKEEPAQTEAEEKPAEKPQEEPAPVAENKPATGENPNDLTEIELKEGSTYLISDFVPPALTTSPGKKEESPVAEAADGGVQDITANGLPAVQQKGDDSNMTVSQLVLENTIKAKRGASLDIKTVPMVPEPAQSDRLQIDGMDDINAEHDLKSADLEPAGKGARVFVGMIIMALLGAVLYGVAAFMNLLPEQYNLLNKLQNKPAVTQQQDARMDEMLGTDMETQTVDENTPLGQTTPYEGILEEVKNYTLPNGMTLKALIDSKHPQAAELISWEISTAVDPDNYSILVKIPPENAQSFKMSYRFNYNAETKALDPTISDAKNLLDSANQPQQN